MNWDARKASVRALESLAVMALYVVAGVAGHAIPSAHGHASPLWPLPALRSPPCFPGSASGWG
jgi:hypothetical protein